MSLPSFDEYRVLPTREALTPSNLPYLDRYLPWTVTDGRHVVIASFGGEGRAQDYANWLNSAPKE